VQRPWSHLKRGGGGWSYGVIAEVSSCEGKWSTWHLRSSIFEVNSIRTWRVAESVEEWVVRD